ncbi:MAG: ankyrin repeat domain-containing protein [Aequorivita sp.]|nr:ankyrin repeat domain-containing protein [Flavobacterium sp.]MCB0452882.1 ankyrin repeat domain-containing protein [Aequorivita sp.]
MARAGRPNKSDPRVESMTFDIQNHENDKVKTLLKEVGVDARDSYLRTALIWATFYGNETLLNWLIDNGANVNHQDRNGDSALHFAAQQKTVGCAKKLIKKGADIEVQDNYGNTPLWRAIFASERDHTLVNLLIENGANLDHVAKHKMTPKDLAETIGGFDFL